MVSGVVNILCSKFLINLLCSEYTRGLTFESWWWQAILQHLFYLLSYFPGSSDTIPEVRRDANDLQRLMPPGLGFRV